MLSCKFFILRASTNGDWGPSTIVGPNVTLPGSGHFMRTTTFLEYEFEQWNGDDLLEGEGCWVVSPKLARAISDPAISGAAAQPLVVNFSLNALALSDSDEMKYLSCFKRLVPTGFSLYNSKLEVLDWNGEDISIGVLVDFVPNTSKLWRGPIESPYTLFVSQTVMDLLLDETRFDIGGCSIDEVFLAEGDR